MRELRKRAGLSQVEVAERSGISQSAISQLENGKLSLDVEWMRNLARLFGCAPADLLSDSDNPGRLSEDERELVETFRAADRNQRVQIQRVSDALVSYTPEQKQTAA